MPLYVHKFILLSSGREKSLRGREREDGEVVTSDLGCVEEANGYESEIQAALLDEFILDLAEIRRFQCLCSHKRFLLCFCCLCVNWTTLTKVWMYLVCRPWLSDTDPSMSALYFGLMAMIIRAKGCFKKKYSYFRCSITQIIKCESGTATRCLWIPVRPEVHVCVPILAEGCVCGLHVVSVSGSGFSPATLVSSSSPRTCMFLAPKAPKLARSQWSHRKHGLARILSSELWDFI